MAIYIAVRLVEFVVTMVVGSFVVFALSHTSGDPVNALLPREATLEEREIFRQRKGFDRNIFVQYGIFLKDAVQGRFPDSLKSNQPASKIVAERTINSLKLAAVAMAIALIISLPLGVLAATHRGTLWDKGALSFALLGQSVPLFWAGIVGVLIFSVYLGWLPTSGTGTWKHYVMPAFIIGWAINAGIVRLLRSSMLEVLDSEYIKLARAKGLADPIVVWKHALRNAVIPVITFVGFMYGIVLAAAIVVEVVFAWPGLGRLTFEATLSRDFPVLQVATLVWVGLIVLINFFVDISYGFIDPRIRISR